MVNFIARAVEILGGGLLVTVFMVVIIANVVIVDLMMKDDDMQTEMELPYPANPGYKGQLTSKEAAREKKSTKKLDQTMVLLALSSAPDGLTADEVAEIYGHVFIKYRPRISELRKAGKIKDSGTRRDSYLGKPQIVWVLNNE
tara:strand:+ start:4840 stop:5268 length:429 start_codon:yes stop_codon:yes gene_type:complete